MKTNKLLCYLLVGCTFFTTFALSAQTLVTRWEAEDFVGNGFQIDANNIPIVVSAGHSGGKFVQRTSPSNSLLYYVNVETAGVYDLKMYYMIQAAAGQIGTKIGVRVNNQIIGGTEVTEFTATDNSTTPASITFPIYLDAGINLIRIGRNNSLPSSAVYTPNFDYFELYTSTETLEKPADDTQENIAAGLTPFIEAGDFTKIPGIFSVTVAGGNTTAANLIDNDPTTEFVSDNDVDTIVISYPSALCTFMLRGIASTNPYIIMGGIERSTDSITWDAGFRSHALFDLNKTVAYSTVAYWNASADPTITTVFQPYHYYRFTVRKPSWESQLRIGDLKICGSLQSYVDLTETANGAYSIEVTGAADGNGVINAFDNSVSSKCSYITSAFNIKYTFNQTAQVDKYLITNAGGPSARDAKDWIFEGSNNETTYVQLDSVSGFVWANQKRATYLARIQTPGIYKCYRLRVKAKQGTDSYLHIGEMQMFGEIKSSIPTSVSTSNYLDLTAFGVNNHILLKANNPTSYQIFDVAGKLIKRGQVNTSELSVPMSKGLYLVKASDKVTKVIVK